MLSRDQPTLGLGPVLGFLACLRLWLLMSSWPALEGGGLCLLPGTVVSSLVSVSGHFRGGEGVGLFELTSCLRGGNESQALPGFLLCEKEDADGTWIIPRTAGRKELMYTSTS